ncbi:19108_t:CDS:1, partial [Gigaspora margarita]
MNMEEQISDDTFFAAYQNYCNKKYEKSFNFFKNIVDKYPNTSRILDAKYYLALHYKDGNFVKKNDNKASDLFEQVAQSNSKYKDNANYHLAMHLIEKNKNKALFLFEQVSQSDSKYKDDAKHMLAIMNKKSLTGDKSYDTINCEYARIKKNYQQSNLTKEYNAIRVKLFNVTSVSSNYVVAFNTYKTMEDNDVLNYRIKYKIGLHLLSGVGCQQDINNG